MTTRHDVERFLNDYKVKLETHDLEFRIHRRENRKTLLELEFRIPDVKKTIKELKVEDYYRGPREDTLNRINSLWEFGKTIKGREVYIKLNFGEFNKSVICVSFHFSERPISYPFKNR